VREFPEFDRDLLARQNFIPAASLVRQQALELSRRVVAAGWRATRLGAKLLYRFHESNASKSRPRWDVPPHYYDNACLEQETITLFIPLSGRTEIWRDHLRPYLDRQTWPRHQTRLVLCDSSQSAEFSREVRQWLAGCDYPDARHLQIAAADAGLADVDRRQPGVDRAVSLACCRIYNRLVESVDANYVWVLEDDVIPPDDAAERLLRCYTPHTAAVSGAYPSRYDPAYVVWGWDGQRVPRPTGGGVQEIAGSGFGCLMVRAEHVRHYVFALPRGQRWYDPAFFASIPRDRKVLVNWNCECQHLGERRHSRPVSAAGSGTLHRVPAAAGQSQQEAT
jgi:hypothetical protein